MSNEERQGNETSFCRISWFAVRVFPKSFENSESRLLDSDDDVDLSDDR
jgi:hypothetical protein